MVAVEEKPVNVLPVMAGGVSGKKISVVNAVLPEKTSLPIEVTVAGKVTLVSVAQSLNTSLSTLVT